MAKLRDVVAANMWRRAKERGITTAVDISIVTGCSKSQVSYMKPGNERANVTIDFIERLAAGLRYPAWRLFVDSDRHDAPEELYRLEQILLSISDEGRKKLLSYAEDILAAETLRKSPNID